MPYGDYVLKLFIALQNLLDALCGMCVLPYDIRIKYAEVLSGGLGRVNAECGDFTA